MNQNVIAPSFKIQCNGLEVEYEILPAIGKKENIDPRKKQITDELGIIEREIEKNEVKIMDLDSEIDRLTNHSDGLDYTIAVASGIITGIIDSFFVGEFSIERANEWGNDKVNSFVIKIANNRGYKGNDLLGAVSYLEKNFPIVADKATNNFGGGRQHHLRDFSHHPTLLGLFFSIRTQFTGRVYGTDVAGKFQGVKLKENDLGLIGNTFTEKITFGVINWFFHMVSDMAGSSGSILEGKLGTGIPGPIVSLLKEMSALPMFKKMNEKEHKEFSVWISKLFNGTLLGKRDENGKIIEPIKFDLRTEKGVKHELGKQTMPIIINECIVRGFYFLRKLVQEIKLSDVRTVSDLKNINWRNTIPTKNRTIVRMITIATSTFTAVDIADAAMRSAIKSGGDITAFLSGFVVRVNFVGVGRMAVAVGTDAYMGVKRGKKLNERIGIYNEQLYLYNAKIFYKQAEVWIEAENTAKAVMELCALSDSSIEYFLDSMHEIQDSLKRISTYVPGMKTNNPGLLEEINNILKE